MMKKAFAYLLSALAVGLVLTSCIRDEIAECPPMRITLAVKDKNYFNENTRMKSIQNHRQFHQQRHY